MNVGKKRKNIEDYIHEVDDFEVLCKVDSKHLVRKWCRLSISGGPVEEEMKTSTSLGLLRERERPVRSPATN